MRTVFDVFLCNVSDYGANSIEARRSTEQLVMDMPSDSKGEIQAEEKSKLPFQGKECSSDKINTPESNNAGTAGLPEDRLHSLDEGQSLNGENVRKCFLPIERSSSPMARQAVQFPQKTSPVNKASLPSPVANCDEALISSDEYQPSDTNNNNRGVSEITQLLKLKFHIVTPPTMSTETKELGATEILLEEEELYDVEIKGWTTDAMQIVEILPIEENNILMKENIGEAAHSEGQRRGLAPSRSSISPIREKLMNAARTSPLECKKPGSDKNEREVGHQRKTWVRKDATCPRNAPNKGAIDLTAEADDHKKILEALKSACSGRYLACSGSFGKDMDEDFSFSSEQTAYSQQQLSVTLGENICTKFYSEDRLQDAQVPGEELLPQTSAFGEIQQNKLNGIWTNGLATTVALDDQLQGNNTPFGRSEEAKFDYDSSLFQHLLFALIEEPDTKECDHHSERRDGSFQISTENSATGSTVDSEIENMEIDIESEVKANPLYNNELKQEGGNLVYPEVRVTSKFGQCPLDGDIESKDVASSEYAYEKMSVDEKLLFELRSLESLPDTEACRAREEQQEIDRTSVELHKELYQKVAVRKRNLLKLIKEFQNAKDAEMRDVEKRGMDELLILAHEKVLEESKCKAEKEATLAFVERTLARYREYKATGRSCFSELEVQAAISSTHQWDAEKAQQRAELKARQRKKRKVDGGSGDVGTAISRAANTRTDSVVPKPKTDSTVPETNTDSAVPETKPKADPAVPEPKTDHAVPETKPKTDLAVADPKTDSAVPEPKTDHAIPETKPKTDPAVPEPKSDSAVAEPKTDSAAPEPKTDSFVPELDPAIPNSSRVEYLNSDELDVGEYPDLYPAIPNSSRVEYSNSDELDIGEYFDLGPWLDSGLGPLEDVPFLESGEGSLEDANAGLAVPMDDFSDLLLSKIGGRFI